MNQTSLRTLQNHARTLKRVQADQAAYTEILVAKLVSGRQVESGSQAKYDVTTTHNRQVQVKSCSEAPGLGRASFSSRPEAGDADWLCYVKYGKADFDQVEFACMLPWPLVINGGRFKYNNVPGGKKTANLSQTGTFSGADLRKIVDSYPGFDYTTRVQDEHTRLGNLTIDEWSSVVAKYGRSQV